MIQVYLWPFGIELFSFDGILVRFCELPHLDVGSGPDGDDHHVDEHDNHDDDDDDDDPDDDHDEDDDDDNEDYLLDHELCIFLCRLKTFFT